MSQSDVDELTLLLNAITVSFKPVEKKDEVLILDENSELAGYLRLYASLIEYFGKLSESHSAHLRSIPLYCEANHVLIRDISIFLTQLVCHSSRIPTFFHGMSFEIFLSIYLSQKKASTFTITWSDIEKKMENEAELMKAIKELTIRAWDEVGVRKNADRSKCVSLNPDCEDEIMGQLIQKILEVKETTPISHEFVLVVLNLAKSAMYTIDLETKTDSV